MNLSEIFVAGVTADPSAIVAIGEAYRLMDYDWDFSIENGVYYCVTMASSVIIIDQKNYEMKKKPFDQKNKYSDYQKKVKLNHFPVQHGVENLALASNDLQQIVQVVNQNENKKVVNKIGNKQKKGKISC